MLCVGLFSSTASNRLTFFISSLFQWKFSREIAFSNKVLRKLFERKGSVSPRLSTRSTVYFSRQLFRVNRFFFSNCVKLFLFNVPLESKHIILSKITEIKEGKMFTRIGNCDVENVRKIKATPATTLWKFSVKISCVIKSYDNEFPLSVTMTINGSWMGCFFCALIHLLFPCVWPKKSNE